VNRWRKITDIQNLTPHEIAVMSDDKMKRIPPSGKIVRITSNCEPCGELDGMPVVLCTEGVPRGLPEPKQGTVYIVSSVVAKSVMRQDVLSPDTSDDGVIRDGNGYIVAVKRLQVFV
jgi:hypothetical protein